MMVKLYFIYSCYLFIHNYLVITVCWFDNLRRLYSMSLPGIVLTDSLSQRTLSSGGRVSPQRRRRIRVAAHRPDLPLFTKHAFPNHQSCFTSPKL